MDSYKVVLSDLAKSQLNDYVNYIQYTLLNDQAAGAVLDDALETIDQLKISAGSLKLCENPELNKLGYHRINFLHHDYLMLYKLNGRTANVDAIYHQMQDYENLFFEDTQ